MLKLKILALHLGYGGVESCICNLANILSKYYDIEILCTYKIMDEPAVKLNKKIKVTYLTDVIPNGNEFKIALKKYKLITCFFLGLESLKTLYLKKHSMIKALKDSDGDIFISSRIYFNNILGKYGHGFKIGWEHNHHHNDEHYIKEFTNSCRYLDKVVLVSKSLKIFYQDYFKRHHVLCQCLYIPNFLTNMPNNVSKLNNNNLISVGRLSQEKGFSDLIDVYKLIDLNISDTHLNIIGDGVEYDSIKQKIIDNNLTRKITLHGFQNQDYINKIYLETSLYLMTSYTESFGLVLIEAMAYGIPCIAYSSAEGANDIIKNNYNGYLIDNRNEHEMADKVVSILNNPKELKRLGENASKTALEYTKDKVLKSWLEALK